jgi:hypothetical protein
LQKSLADIKPILAELRYAVPALTNQQNIMTEQTLQLLGDKKRFEGYMEIGSTGRYISRLQDALDIRSERYLLHTVEAGYGPEDIVERGQLSKIGSFVDMGNYSSAFAQTVNAGSPDLITVYIGFHHCPIPKREEFISSVRDCLKPGAKLILRDHDARDETMRRITALAHDTFNAGTSQSWNTNEKELRNFYPPEFIIGYLEKLGLRYDGKVLFQDGDPTRNGLMSFTKA